MQTVDIVVVWVVRGHSSSLAMLQVNSTHTTS